MRGFLDNGNHKNGMQMDKCAVYSKGKKLSFGWNVKNMGSIGTDEEWI